MSDAKRRERLKAAVGSLLAHVEHQIPEGPGSLPFERAPVIAEVLRTIAETEAIIAGMEMPIEMGDEQAK